MDCQIDRQAVVEMDVKTYKHTQTHTDTHRHTHTHTHTYRQADRHTERWTDTFGYELIVHVFRTGWYPSTFVKQTNR